MSHTQFSRLWGYQLRTKWRLYQGTAQMFFASETYTDGHKWNNFHTHSLPENKSEISFGETIAFPPTPYFSIRWILACIAGMYLDEHNTCDKSVEHEVRDIFLSLSPHAQGLCLALYPWCISHASHSDSQMPQVVCRLNELCTILHTLCGCPENSGTSSETTSRWPIMNYYMVCKSSQHRASQKLSYQWYWI